MINLYNLFKVKRHKNMKVRKINYLKLQKLYFQKNLVKNINNNSNKQTLQRKTK